MAEMTDFENWSSYRRRFAGKKNSNLLYNAPPSQEKLRRKMREHFGIGTVYFGKFLVRSKELDIVAERGNHVVFQNGKPDYALEAYFHEGRQSYEMKDVIFNEPEIERKKREGVLSFVSEMFRSTESMSIDDRL